MTVLNTTSEGNEKDGKRLGRPKAKPKMMLVEREEIQILSISAIVVDPSIQSRVELDVEHCRFLAGELELYDDLKPILVFFDGTTYWLANGFHRVFVYRKAGRKTIRAIVKQGGKREAVVESARNNDATSKGKTREDRKKSVMMLLEDEEWFKEGNSKIAKYCGVQNQQTVAKYRAEFCNKQGLCVPKNKSTHGPRAILGQREPTRYNNRGSGGYVAGVNGKTKWLGSDYVAAKEKLAAMDAEKLPIEASTRHRETTDLGDRMATRGISTRRSGFAYATKISARLGEGFVFDAGDVADVDSFRAACLNVLVVRQAMNPKARGVVVCFKQIAKAPIKSIIESIEGLGVEFLTPDEFIASVKSDDAQP